jgi:hypothetical protein
VNYIENFQPGGDDQVLKNVYIYTSILAARYTCACVRSHKTFDAIECAL